MTLRLDPVRLVAESRNPLLGVARGWNRVPLGQVADVINGCAFPSSRFGRNGGMPLVRIRDVVRGSTQTSYDGPFDDIYRVPPGSLLVGMDGDFHVGIWSGPEALLNQRVCRIVVRDPSIYSERFLRFVLPGYLDEVNRHTSSVTVKHLSSETLKALPIPLPSRLEQDRVVAAIEEEFSRLDAAARLVISVTDRRARLVRSILESGIPLVPPSGWSVITVGEAGELKLGRQRAPKYHIGTGMRPYLRVANVFEDRIDTSDVMSMTFSDAEFERFRLIPGDVLLNEGQSPELLGRPALYRGTPPETAYTNTLLRFRAGAQVLPEWALLVFRRHMHSGRFVRESRITTNIAHLSAGRLATVEFPVPPLAEQAKLVDQLNVQLTAVDAGAIGAQRAIERSRSLRRAVLAAAFAGRLAAMVHSGSA